MRVFGVYNTLKNSKTPSESQGAWQFPSSMLVRTFNALVPVISSLSGAQLMLQVGRVYDHAGVL